MNLCWRTAMVLCPVISILVLAGPVSAQDLETQQKISSLEGGFPGEGLDAIDLFGDALTMLGDLDDDGVADMAVGVPFDDDGVTDRGAVWILFLYEDGSVKARQKISDSQGGFDETLPVLEDWDLWLRVFQLAEPVHVPRVTSEVRQRSDGSNMTAENQSRWSEVCAQIYGKTLDFERRDSRLRQRRLAYLLKLAEEGRHPFPAEAEVWLRGAPDLWPIDPENPIPKQPSPRV